MTAHREKTRAIEPWTVTLRDGNATGVPPLEGEGVLDVFQSETGRVEGPFLLIDIVFSEGFRFHAPQWIGHASPEGIWLWDMPGAPHDGTDPPGFTALLPRDVPLVLRSLDGPASAYTLRWTGTGRLEVAPNAP